MTAATAPTAAAEQQTLAGSHAAPARGGYARREVEMVLRAEGSPELSLAPPFGALFAALLPARTFRVRQLQLEFVDPERLGERATYSAQVGEPLEGGQAVELRLLVARGAWLCVHGRAVIELGPQPQSEPARGHGHG